MLLQKKSLKRSKVCAKTGNEITQIFDRSKHNSFKKNERQKLNYLRKCDMYGIGLMAYDSN